MKLKRTAMVAALVLATTAGTGALAGAANAGSYDGNCDNHEVCLWSSPNFKRGKFDIVGSVKDYKSWKYYNLNHTVNDSVSSMKNNADTYNARFFRGDQCEGRYFTVGDNAERTSIGEVYDNLLTSHCMIPGA